MKKLKLLFFLILTIAAGVYIFSLNINSNKDENRQPEKTDINQTEYEKLKNQVDDAAIIKKALKTVGILGVLEGQEDYEQTIEEQTWFSYRGIKINWHYRFSIAMNLEEVGVKVSNGVVDITADNHKLFIWFIEKTKDSVSHSEASWFAKKYSSQEISALEKVILEKVENKIKTTDNYWDEAGKSLEMHLIKFCNDLGYYNIKISKDSSQ